MRIGERRQLRSQITPPDRAFTLVELLIVVVILGILAAVVVPFFTDASEDAKRSNLTANLRVLRSAISQYVLEHDGRAPHMLPNRNTDTNTDNFSLRLTTKTKGNGAFGPGTPKLGPYLKSMPSNPFSANSADGAKVQFGTGSPPSGTAGWYFNTNTFEISANTSGHESY